MHLAGRDHSHLDQLHSVLAGEEHPPLQHQLQRSGQYLPGTGQHIHSQLAARFRRLRNHGTVYDSVQRNCHLADWK